MDTSTKFGKSNEGIGGFSGLKNGEQRGRSENSGSVLYLVVKGHACVRLVSRSVLMQDKRFTGDRNLQFATGLLHTPETYHSSRCCQAPFLAIHVVF
jgi:hypothetical protein